jgi:ABC-type branched-subunit amino acid transport system ATPase component
MPQIGVHQIGRVKHSAAQAHSREIDARQNHPAQVGAIENDADDQEDTSYGGYEDAAALQSAVYGDGENEHDDLDASVAALEDARDWEQHEDGTAYGSVAALEESPSAEDPELAGAMGDISGRDPDYRYEEELAEEETDYEPSIALEVRPLDIPEKVRLLRMVARAESGRDGYSAINPDNEYNDPHHPAYHRYHIGLSFGFIQFTQRSGLLGQTLKAARTRSLAGTAPSERFEALFGSDWQQLLDVTNASSAEARVAPVGDRGAGFSAEERQLLAFARALVRDPEILILDEATAHVDPEAEELIERGVAELMRGRTTFVIAHRLSTIRLADEIVVLDRGQVVERGTHDELVAKGGAYAQLERTFHRT